MPDTAITLALGALCLFFWIVALFAHSLRAGGSLHETRQRVLRDIWGLDGLADIEANPKVRKFFAWTLTMLAIIASGLFLARIILLIFKGAN